MNPDKQWIEIAKACPFVRNHDGDCFWTVGGWSVVFDPLNDLNAMHEAESTLKPIDVAHYSRELIEVTRASVALANGETC